MNVTLRIGQKSDDSSLMDEARLTPNGSTEPRAWLFFRAREC